MQWTTRSVASAKHDVVQPSGGLFLCSLAVFQKKRSWNPRVSFWNEAIFCQDSVSIPHFELPKLAKKPRIHPFLFWDQPVHSSWAQGTRCLIREWRMGPNRKGGCMKWCMSACRKKHPDVNRISYNVTIFSFTFFLGVVQFIFYWHFFRQIGIAQVKRMVWLHENVDRQQAHLSSLQRTYHDAPRALAPGGLVFGLCVYLRSKKLLVHVAWKRRIAAPCNALSKRMLMNLLVIATSTCMLLLGRYDYTASSTPFSWLLPAES